MDLLWVNWYYSVCTEGKQELVCNIHKDGRTIGKFSNETDMSFSDNGSIIKNENEEAEPKKTR